MPELKPCPFCGGEANLNRTYDGSYCVQCVESGNRTLLAKNKKSAVDKWNARVNETGLG